MNLKQKAQIAKKHLMQLDLSNSALVRDFGSLNVYQYATRFALKSFLKFALASQESDASRIEVDMSGDATEISRAFNASIRDEKTDLSILNPPPNLFLDLLKQDWQTISSSLAEVYVVREMADKDTLADYLGYLEMPIPTGMQELLIGASEENLFCIAQALLFGTTIEDKKGLGGVIDGMIQGIVYAWQVSDFENTQAYADFAAYIGDLNEQAKKVYAESFARKWSLCVTGRECAEFDYSDTPFDEITKAMFMNLVLSTADASLPAEFGAKAIAALDYHFRLVIGE